MLVVLKPIINNVVANCLASSQVISTSWPYFFVVQYCVNSFSLAYCVRISRSKSIIKAWTYLRASFRLLLSAHRSRKKLSWLSSVNVCMCVCMSADVRLRTKCCRRNAGGNWVRVTTTTNCGTPTRYLLLPAKEREKGKKARCNHNKRAY